MRKAMLALALVVSPLTLLGCTSRPTSYTPVAGASQGRVYDGYEGYQRKVTTDSREAQRFFDQGMQLLYGFNHDEAIRSFEEAAAIDPECAMAYWGIAYANGININDPMMSEVRSRQAYAAAQEALRRSSDEAPVEKALIGAVAERYAYPAPKNRRSLDEAYANAMEKVWLEFTDDPDVGALYAESLMNLQPWNYWTKSGAPKGRILHAVHAIERVLKDHPYHPGANHFYIHAMEASPEPEKAVPAAERLDALVPGSGHLVHMPSHIYARVARYADAADSNERAIRADEAYFAKAPEPQFYRLYFIHNVHFLTFAAMMEGRYETAIGAARRIDAEVPEEFLRAFVFLADGLMPTSRHVLIRFGKWQEILDMARPREFQKLSIAMHHYARGIALSALGRASEAREEQGLFTEAAKRVPGDWWVFQNKVHDILPVAEAMLEGEILYREGKQEEAFDVLRQGVALEDKLVYDEPPGWMIPVRHALGALLMGAGRHAEAERVYREDQVHYPGNGWSLLGLEQALRAQGKTEEAERVGAQLKTTWARADVRPTSSCFCQPGE
ncbi:MAG: hypothetical protein AB7G17_00760 [Phycisphaerales bacterium]